MKFNPSKTPVVENDQHDPHCPWFLTGVTAPLALQSTEAGNSPSFETTVSSATSVEIDCPFMFKHPFKAPNSAVFKSANSLSPTDEVWVGSEFQF